MRKVFIVLLLVIVLISTTAFADTYTLEEILPSVSYLSDEELDSLFEAIINEQETRKADQTTDTVERTPIQRGDKGDEAKALQERLIELGFLSGTADGDFGKKTEAAVKLFQKANRLEETGIADNITQSVLFSDNPVDNNAFDNMPIATGDGWEMIKEYYYSSSFYHYYIFTLKNVSGYNATINANVVFYDAENNIVGVANDTEYACENGYVTYWDFSNDLDFDHATAEITMSEEDWYEAGQSSLEVTTSVVGKKVIIAAKNIGKKTVSFPEYNVLFLNDAGEVVYTAWGYLTDNDSEIKPGATEMRDETSYENFTDVEVYVHGRIDD